MIIIMVHHLAGQEISFFFFFFSEQASTSYAVTIVQLWETKTHTFSRIFELE